MIIRLISSLGVLIFFQISTLLGKDVPEELFMRANAHYESHSYDSALVIYNQIIQMGYVSPELYYNLGNCHFKLKQLGLARYYYEKSMQLSPFDNAIAHNLELLIELLPGDSGYGMPSELSKIIYFISNSSFQKYAFWASILLLIGGVYFLNKYFSNKEKISLLKWISVTGISLMLVLMLYWLNIKRETQFAVLVADNSYVKNEPKESSPDLFVLQAGAKVLILEDYFDFIKIRMNDGKIGWTKRANLMNL